MAMAMLAVIAAATGAGAGYAAALDVTVRGADGHPVADAVVTFAAARAASDPARLPGPFEMTQHNIAFVPHVLIVPVGANVAFPNLDLVRHHVYSFSKTKRFELKLYGKDQTRSVLFDKPGVVAIGCNIHDAMSGYIIVVETPYAGKTDAAGHVVLSGVPAGAGTLAVWHPSIRGAGNSLAQTITLPAGGLARTVSTGGDPRG